MGGELEKLLQFRRPAVSESSCRAVVLFRAAGSSATLGRSVLSVMLVVRHKASCGVRQGIPLLLVCCGLAIVCGGL